MTDYARWLAAVGTITADGHTISVKYHSDTHTISACMADEDGCSYKHCPRWRDGVLIDARHCALDFMGDEP